MKSTMKLTIATLSGILFISSVHFTAMAAPSLAPSEMMMKTAAAKKNESKAEKLEKEETAKIDKLLAKNPEDLYAVYVSNELTKTKGMEVFFKGNVQPKYDSYKNYLKKASTLKDGVLQQPADLPEGYEFVTAAMKGPNSGEYSAEMKAEAKKLGKQVYSKKINWVHARGIELEYANGERKLILGFMRLDPNEVVNQKGYVYQSAEELSKKSKMYEKDPKNMLIWFEKGKQFKIETDPGNPLTKEDLIKLAKTMVKK
ncbi:hypothetical protein ABE142_18200 [Paenibacillus alvei]|uniref:hypothetical protein n=1 Tax=Paenibacillus alvei TaxID=44250 RepID=UPI003D2DDC35